MFKPLSDQQNTATSTNSYRSFQQANAQLGGLEAVDYFFAQEISQCLGFSAPSNEILLVKPEDQEQQQFFQQQWFHLLIALSASLRAGHSCLPLTELAGKRSFIATSTDVDKAGFLFAELDELNALMQQLPLGASEQHPIVFSHQALYLRRYFQFEQELKQVVYQRRAIKQQQLTRTEPVNNIDVIQRIISDLFPALATQIQSVNQQASKADNTDIDWQAVAVANAINKNFAIIDARSAARFCGTATEPRAGMRSGHIPDSLNLPFANILADHCMKNPAQLADIFASMIPNKQTEIIFTCGSGITACIIMLAASIAGYQHTVLYDGSWSDWGSDESLAIEVTLSE